MGLGLVAVMLDSVASMRREIKPELLSGFGPFKRTNGDQMVKRAFRLSVLIPEAMPPGGITNGEREQSVFVCHGVCPAVVI